MKYKIKDKITGKSWGYLYNIQDAENAILHLEDQGYNPDYLYIIEVKE